MKRVLSVASECAPLVKTGGLADVAGALPAAMASVGWEIRTLLPGYPAIMKAIKSADKVLDVPDLFGGSARVLTSTIHGLNLFVLDAPHLYNRSGSIYLTEGGRDWPDNPERFAALCWVAAEIAAGKIEAWVPDLVHGHDWQAGFVPSYLRGHDIPTLFTVHNIAFHGLAPAARLAYLRLPPDRFHSGGFEFWGQISALKAGLVDASKISTVSPTYARELTLPEFGMGLDGVIQVRQPDLSGILNGIDLEIWDPASDPEIKPFKAPAGKAANKAALQQEFDLPIAKGPLCIVVSRLTEQKGLDLLLEALPTLLKAGGQLALLGSGDSALETAFEALAAEQPDVGVRIGYDEALSHRMFAGADAVLVPSRFEPCGLTQMYGLRYGAVPVVARVGGLADTVINANDAALKAGVATGLQVSPVSASALSLAFTRLLELYNTPKTWARVQRNGMKHPVGWDSSAQDYAALYEQLVAR